MEAVAETDTRTEFNEADEGDRVRLAEKQGEGEETQPRDRATETTVEQNSKSKIHSTHPDAHQLTASYGRLPSLDRRAELKKGARLPVGGRNSVGAGGEAGEHPQ